MESQLNVTESAGGGVVTELLYVVLVYTLLEDRGLRFNNPCVGVLLRRNLVLTTLSCLHISQHGDVDVELVMVYLRNSQVLKPERVFLQHAAEGPSIALLQCDDSTVDYFPRLPEREFALREYEFCTLCGYGGHARLIQLDAFASMRINRSDVRACSGYAEGQTWICLHFGTVIPCRGDVGAPLLCDGAVTAIFNPPVAPWAPASCLDTTGATFTVLYPLVPWILRVERSLDVSVLSHLNKPYYWVGLAVTVVTVTVAIYWAIMKYAFWVWSEDEPGDQMDGASANTSVSRRVVFVRSSQMSRITERWLQTK